MTKRLEAHWRAWLDDFRTKLPKRFNDAGEPAFDDVRAVVWQGAVEAVSPKDLAKRDAIRHADGFPWEPQDDIRLYWRLFAAAQAELGIGLMPTDLTEILARPLGVVSGLAADALGPTAQAPFHERLLKGLVHMAAAHINHMPLSTLPAPKIFIAGETVRRGGVTAAFVTCTTNGQVVIDRETAPTSDPTWQLDVRDGRHSVAVWPWELTRL